MQQFLEEHGLVVRSQVTDLGWEVISELLDRMGKYPNLTPGKQPSPHGIFEKVGGLMVPSCVELLLIREGKIYLTYRNDQYFKGYHVPGSYIAPRETFLETAKRIARRETIGVAVTGGMAVGLPFNHCNNPRFHDVAVLFLAEFDGNPPVGKDVGGWFDEKPDDLIDGHQEYWPTIAEYLAKK